jgi:TetR/AcrR family transcriptional repressor of nem operon
MQPHDSKRKLLDAAIHSVRAKGYTATRIEDVCTAAGVTKGSFFHHFKSKDDLALAALHHWGSNASAIFDHAPYHDVADPLGRILAYLDFRKALLTGDLADFTCLAGTMVQELYATNPDVRAACETSLRTHTERLAPDIAEAMRQHHVTEDVTAESLALHMQCVLQGAFILAKATGSAAIAAQSIDHLRRYFELLFQTADNRDAVAVP